MAEQTEVSATETGAENTPSAPKTLDDVYTEYNVSVTPPETQPPPQSNPGAPVEPAAPPSTVGSPPSLEDDPRAAVAWLVKQQAETARLARQADERANAIIERDRKASQDKVVNDACKLVSDAAGENVSMRRAKTLIAERYADDLRFRKVFDNPIENPAAWKAALEVIAADGRKEFGGKLVDAQTAEDQRAVDSAINAKPSRDSVRAAQPKIAGMTGRNFDAEWDRIRRGGQA